MYFVGSPATQAYLERGCLKCLTFTLLELHSTPALVVPSPGYFEKVPSFGAAAEQTIGCHAMGSCYG